VAQGSLHDAHITRPPIPPSLVTSRFEGSLTGYQPDRRRTRRGCAAARIPFSCTWAGSRRRSGRGRGAARVITAAACWSAARTSSRRCSTGRNVAGAGPASPTFGMRRVAVSEGAACAGMLARSSRRAHARAHLGGGGVLAAPGSSSTRGTRAAVQRPSCRRHRPPGPASAPTRGLSTWLHRIVINASLCSWQPAGRPRSRSTTAALLSTRERAWRGGMAQQPSAVETQSSRANALELCFAASLRLPRHLRECWLLRNIEDG